MSESKAAMCAIDGCPNTADRNVTHRHPNESMRWSADMCGECSRLAFDMSVGGHGEITFGHIKGDAR